jgi:hypothetical protein
VSERKPQGKIEITSEFIGCGVECGDGNQIGAVIHPAFDLNGITASQTPFELIDGKFHIAVAAGDRAVSVPISPFVPIAACASVEEGEYLSLNFENEIIDVFPGNDGCGISASQVRAAASMTMFVPLWEAGGYTGWREHAENSRKMIRKMPVIILM